MESAVLEEIQRIFGAAGFISDLGIELASGGEGEEQLVSKMIATMADVEI